MRRLNKIIISLVFISIFFLLMVWIFNSNTCKMSITTVSGFAAPKIVCAGDLLFEELFDSLDKNKWRRAVTFSSQHNSQFAWYTADSENGFAKDGKLQIKPTLTADKIGIDKVEQGYIQLDNCTDSNRENCICQAGGDIIINPVRSARLDTKNSFSFKYGRMEVIAKTPVGDWLWPSVRLIPKNCKYGQWPRSSRIDLLKRNGNIKYENDTAFENLESTIYFGNQSSLYHMPGTVNAFVNSEQKKICLKSYENGYDTEFHKYELFWNEFGIRFSIDDTETGFITADDGFWRFGEVKIGKDIWASSDKIGPFDEEFYIVIDLAVGGSDGFYSDANNERGKNPWNDDSPTAMKVFWLNRHQWLSSWQSDKEENTSFIVESIRVWAI